jgi:hypothetical protein
MDAMSMQASVRFCYASVLLFFFQQISLVNAQSLKTETRAIWHCSRQDAAVQHTSELSIKDEFKLSSMDTISVTLTDLVNIYSGIDVQIGNIPLKGCFMPGQDDLSIDILTSLDLKPHVLQKLSAKSAIVQSQLVTVTDEEQMQVCLNTHFPSFGYLSREVVTEKFAPCF